MSLVFLTGSSGSGKSYTIYREIIEASMAHPEKQFLLIVPEQFTMQAQKELVRMHPRHGLLNVDVLSFHRLAWRVFGETGGSTLPVLEETGKSLVVQRVIARHQKKLKVLGRALSGRGAAAQMKSLVSELLQYGVQPEDLEDWIRGQKESLLSRKMEDIEMLYRAFREYLENNFLPKEEVPDILCRVIPRSPLIRGSVIWFDGFTGFTPLQYRVLRELLIYAEQVTVSVTIDPDEDLFRSGNPHELFYMSREMMRRCGRLADETHTPVLPLRTASAGPEGRYKNSPELAFLEQNLFRYRREKAVFLKAASSGTDGEKAGLQIESSADFSAEASSLQIGENAERTQREHYSRNFGHIEICEAQDPGEELRHVTAQIVRMVRENGWHYRDFAVVAGDLEVYGEAAAACFRRENIPFFLDRKEKILTNPFVECIRAALQVMTENYSYESVFRFLRSGMTDYSPEEIDELENYVLACGIHGRKAWEKEWLRIPKYLDQNASALTKLNEMRERFVSETEDFHRDMHDRKGTIRDKTKALYLFLTRYDPQERIERMQDELQEAGEPVRAKAYAQSYAVVIDLLDKIVEVLGSEKAGMAAYAEILDAGFEELRVGTIPPGEDQVLIGDIERTRLKTIKVLFLV
ncbi:MAG: helicase-exonuclease AddAB subunit AddB, partial [Eubacterium sp.]|nr:helicase-exonuclease AddAB subunit AddB [Eubacterium sp.]